MFSERQLQLELCKLKMAARRNELVLTVPAELVRRCKGLAIDMGGSVQKYVYRSKNDKDEVSSEAVKYGHLHMVSFSKRELDEALEYIRHRAVVTINGPEPPSVYTTGMGCSQFGRQLCQQLNIKVEQLTEFDCFVKSFFYLASRLPRTELLETYIEVAAEEPLKVFNSQLPHIEQMNQDNVTQTFSVDMATVAEGIQMALGRPSAAALEAGDVPLAEAEPDIFPCILAMCGSGLCFMKIERDGSHKMVDSSYRGGKSFVAIGSLLTKTKSYDEFMELAALGVQRNVDQFTDQLIDGKNLAEGDQSFYSKAEHIEPSLVFCFGNALDVDLADLRREDVARAWLNYVVLDVAQLAQSACIENGVKRLFFCGGFCSHPFVRHLLTAELVRHNLLKMVFTQAAVPQFDFIKHGAYLGALGCLINDVDKFIGK